MGNLFLETSFLPGRSSPLLRTQHPTRAVAAKGQRPADQEGLAAARRTCSL